MSELRLLRRPLPPKAEPERYIPKRKCILEIPEKEKKPKKPLGDVDGQPFLPSESHQIVYLPFPDYEDSVRVLSPLKKNVIIPVQLSGPPSFPMQRGRIPIRLKIPALKGGHFELPPDWTLCGMPFGGSSPRSVRQESAQEKRFISHLNYEVFSSHLIAEEIRTSPELSKITLEFGKLHVPKTKVKKMVVKSMLGERQEEETEELVHEEVTDVITTLPVPAASSSLVFKEYEMVPLAEMVVLFCLMHRKPELSLKGYFLSLIPDISPLSDFLLYLNLSYNYLESIPSEVFCLENLEVLNLRNNPIKCVPREINRLKNLKFLSLAFNLLTTLPPELFTLPKLQVLDLSYNELERIPNEIRNLRNLKYLNLEGNLLYFLPCGILQLQLNHLMLENNYLHPYFWNEIMLLQPQRLADMAAFIFVKHKLWRRYPDIPQTIQDFLSNFSGCDCCNAPLYGDGIRFILIYKNACGLKIPYQFSACTPACYKEYIQSIRSTY